MKKDLAELRNQIDAIDGEMVSLFEKRMAVSEQVAQVKMQNNLAILDASREEKVIARARERVSPKNEAEAAALMNCVMALSKMRQKNQLIPAGEVFFPPSGTRKTENITVAFQGVDGAWGEQAAKTMFPQATHTNRDYFDDVFESVTNGTADFGILPIENSQTGAIGEVYDLLRRHRCYIVGQVWVDIAHCLLALPGTEITDIREVLSHPEGFSQCGRFIKGKNLDCSASTNTAVAAKTVAERGEKRYAAIASRHAADLFGLEVIAPNIMDNPNNRTRFIAIAAKPLYDESCNTVGITFSTMHKSGALCAVLQSFMLAGINLSRIESRPVSAEKYRFFADLQANILSPATKDVILQAATNCEYFEILGCYNV